MPSSCPSTTRRPTNPDGNYTLARRVQILMLFLWAVFAIGGPSALARTALDPLVRRELDVAVEFGRLMRQATGEDARVIRVVMPNPPRTVDVVVPQTGEAVNQ